MSAISGTLLIASIQLASVGKSGALPWNVIVPETTGAGGTVVGGTVVSVLGSVVSVVSAGAGAVTATGTGGVDAAANDVSEIPGGNCEVMRLIIFCHATSDESSVFMLPC